MYINNSKIFEIKKYLPHQSPMLMVDCAITITKEEVKTRFLIKKDNIFVERDIFQEMGLIENAAQTCSTIVGQTFFFDEKHNEIDGVKVLGFISNIRKLEIFGFAKVGDEIETSANLISRFDAEDYSICTMKVRSFASDNKLLEADINLVLQKQ